MWSLLLSPKEGPPTPISLERLTMLDRFLRRAETMLGAEETDEDLSPGFLGPNTGKLVWAALVIVDLLLVSEGVPSTDCRNSGPGSPNASEELVMRLSATEEVAVPRRG